MAHGYTILTHLSAFLLPGKNLREAFEFRNGINELPRDGADVALQLFDARRELYLIREHHFDFEERVGESLPVSVYSPGEFLEGPLDVESKGLLHHPVHTLGVVQPVRVDITTVATEHLRTTGSQVKLYIEVYRSRRNYF